MTTMVAIFHRGPLNNGKEIHCSECGRVFENWDDFDEHIKICKLETERRDDYELEKNV